MMAIVMHKEHNMQTPLPHPPNTEGPFLPRMNDRGILARFGDCTEMSMLEARQAIAHMRNREV